MTQLNSKFDRWEWRTRKGVRRKNRLGPSRSSTVCHDWLTVTMEGRGAPVKCSITSQFDFLEGVWGVRGVLGVCGWGEDGVEDLEPGGSSSNSTLGFPPSLAATCCRRLAHLLVLLTDPATDLAATSPCAKKKTVKERISWRTIVIRFLWNVKWFLQNFKCHFLSFSLIFLTDLGRVQNQIHFLWGSLRYLILFFFFLLGFLNFTKFL